MTTTKKFQLENYKKYLLNRNTASSTVISYIENCLVTEDETAKHSFHKIMVHNWPGNHIELFDTLMEYFQCPFIPVNCTSQGEIITFYTSSLSFIMKAVKFDFMFPYQRNMFNLDLLFNDRSSNECFNNRVTLDDVVTGVVSNRLSDKLELDLSSLCNDPEFLEKKIHFYKLSLLSQYKILMIRMGRDAKSLNLSRNNLSTVPLDLLNFFIKGDLTSLNLSHNKVPTLAELQRNSKIEKLWLEGNPLCEGLEPVAYVKNVVMRFPRLIELDGIILNQHGIMLPFYKNYLETQDKKTKMLVEKFLTLYFAHYDSNRKKISTFYEVKATLTISTSFTDGEDAALPAYASHSRNILHPIKRKFVVFNNKMYRERNGCVQALTALPKSEHDPTTFTVDVLKHDKKCLIIAVDGTYREKSYDPNNPFRYYRFRRTFIFNIYILQCNSVYHIAHEMFSVSFATQEQKEKSFQNPIRNMNSLALINPEPEESEAICRAFSHISQLKRKEVELRLKLHNWDLRSAIKEFWDELRLNKITADKFAEEEFDDFSDTSSLVDEID